MNIATENLTKSDLKLSTSKALQYSLYRLLNILIHNYCGCEKNQRNYKIDISEVKEYTGFKTNNQILDSIYKLSKINIIREISESDSISCGLVSNETSIIGSNLYYNFPIFCKKLIDNNKIDLVLKIKTEALFKNKFASDIYAFIKECDDEGNTDWWDAKDFRDLIAVPDSKVYKNFKTVGSKIIKPSLLEINTLSFYNASVEYIMGDQETKAVRFVVEKKDPEIISSILIDQITQDNEIDLNNNDSDNTDSPDIEKVSLSENSISEEDNQTTENKIESEDIISDTIASDANSEELTPPVDNQSNNVISFHKDGENDFAKNKNSEIQHEEKEEPEKVNDDFISEIDENSKENFEFEPDLSDESDSNNRTENRTNSEDYLKSITEEELEKLKQKFIVTIQDKKMVNNRFLKFGFSDPLIENLFQQYVAEQISDNSQKKEVNQ